MNEGLGGLTLSFSFFSKVAIQTPLATCLARYEHSQSLSIFGAHAHDQADLLRHRQLSA